VGKLPFENSLKLGHLAAAIAVIMRLLAGTSKRTAANRMLEPAVMVDAADYRQCNPRSYRNSASNPLRPSVCCRMTWSAFSKLSGAT